MRQNLLAVLVGIALGLSVGILLTAPPDASATSLNYVRQSK